VIVFRYPENPSVDYIKRVVGVPGDEIAYLNKVLYINGKKIEQEPLGVYQAGFPNLKRFKEDLDGVEHDILVNIMAPAGDFVVKVPPNSYFVLGDNRDNSRDSRFWGFVPDENLVGKAFMIWMNWQWGHWPKWNRIGTIIE
jgi:signal peptidase I